MANNLIASTAKGKLRGLLQRSIDGHDYYAFKGIPYAKPPVGPLRFQDPLPAKSWSGIRDAIAYGSMCVQWNFALYLVAGDEDCLYLNVYTRSVGPSPPLRPVMVWVHGGAFIHGNGSDDCYGPDYLLRKDIVYVTMNYRLGVFGFLNLEHELAPGNQGLKDQVLALQWVRDNIVNFGGDPNNVTIFGESAGGASVHYLAISPLAKGLFHKVISQSGVALNTWASIPHNPKRFAYQMCTLLGNNSRDPKEIVDFLRTVDSKKLIDVQQKLVANGESIQLMFPFGPGVDDKAKHPFMAVHPAVAAEEGVQVPLLIGYCNREGLITLAANKKDVFHRLNNNFEKCLHPQAIELIKRYNLTPIELKSMYCNHEEINSENCEKIVDLLGDIYFVEGIQRVVKTQVERSCAPTYLYQFTFDKNPSLIKSIINSSMSGACHWDDVQNLFPAKKYKATFYKPIQKGSDAYKLMEQMTELWVNFATTGRPTPIKTELIPFYWQPVDSGTVLRYLNIGEELRMEVSLNLELRYSAHKITRNML